MLNVWNIRKAVNTILSPAYINLKNKHQINVIMLNIQITGIKLGMLWMPIIKSSSYIISSTKLVIKQP